MQNKPMKLDLSEFFVDERKCSLILLDGSWQNIKNLQDHIQNLFQLNGISLLTGDGSYLPPRESIEVLRNADSLKAFKFAPPVDEESHVEVASTKKLTKKRKSPSTDLELACSTPNHPKRSKNFSNHTCSLIPITEELSSKPESKKKRSKRENGRNKVETDLEKGQPSLVTREGDTTNKENTLKAVINEKIVNQTDQESHTVSTHLALDQKVAEEEETRNETVSRPLEVIFRCALMELVSETPRIFKLPRPDPPVKILENIFIPAVIPQALEVADIEPLREAVEPAAEIENQTLDLIAETNSSSEIELEKDLPADEMNPDNVVLNSDSEDDIMVLDDSDSDVQTVAPVLSSRKSDTTDVISDLLQSGVSLSNLPNKGDTLVFKLPKSKGSKILEKTEFLAGTCMYVNRRTKTITISMISYPRYLLHVLRQYKTNLNDTEEDVPVLNVNMKDLLEANVCVSSVD